MTVTLKSADRGKVSFITYTSVNICRNILLLTIDSHKVHKAAAFSRIAQVKSFRFALTHLILFAL